LRVVFKQSYCGICKEDFMLKRGLPAFAWLAIAGLSIALSPCAWAAGIDAMGASISSAPAGIATAATFTATISDTTVIPGSVNLVRVDSSGRATVVGTMHDDGLNGDATAGDHIYSLALSIFEQTTGTVNYKISAAFPGSLTRSQSGLIPITISGISTGITISAPADPAYLNISPTVVTGTVGDPSATVKVNGINAQVSSGTFSASVPLQEGTNTLTAVSLNSNNSVSTASKTVTLDTTPPHVTIDSPPNNFVTTDSSITVAGIVNDIVVGTVNNQQATVIVNGVPAAVTNRTYSAAAVPLALGVNTIQATGRDRAGNFATVSISVTRQTPTQPGLTMVSGNGLSGSIQTLLASPLVVKLLNGSGQAIANTPVVFSVTGGDGTVSATATSGLPSVAVNTNAQGQAQVYLTLGTRAGAGNNVVTASSVGIATTAVFTESATSTAASMIVVDSGNSQSGVVGQALPLPFIAITTDAGHNRLGNVPVTFTATQGGGSFAGQPSLTTSSDSDGRVAAVLTLGSAAGPNVVTANFTGNTGLPATFTAQGLVPGPPANTTISGVVLDNSNNPINGVTMRLYQTNSGVNNNVPQQVGSSVTTNAQGFFQITSAPVGVFKLMADGTTAISGGPFPTLEYDLVTVAGQNNTVGSPIYLPQISSSAQLCVSATVGGTLTVPQAPGFALTIAPGSATFPGGTQTGCVSVTPVNPDKIPMVPGFGQQPRFIVTIQPVGTTFNPPAAIRIPNVDGLAPRAVTEMYSYDHDLATFTAIGTGTVSADGSVIASDPGVGVLKAGWHCGGDPNTSGSAASLGVSINPGAIVKGVGATFSVTANGTPAQDGSYSWEMVATQPNDDPSIATLTDAPSCPDQGTCVATLSGVRGGKATLRVHFICSTTGAQATADMRVTIVQVNSITMTIPHITNCSQCANVPNWNDDTVTTTNTDKNPATDMVAMPRKSETANLVCNTTPINTDPDVLSVLKWQIKRNPGNGSTPALNPSGANATLGFDDQGSFNNFCYVDDNGNNQADTSESQIVLNVTLVGITLNTFAPVVHPALLTARTPTATCVATNCVGITTGGYNGAAPDGFDFANTGNAAFYVSSTVTLTGGGADGTLGVDKIDVFFMQNFKNDSFTATYDQTLDLLCALCRTVKEIFVCDTTTAYNLCAGNPAIVPFPTIDKGYPPALPNGGIDPSSAGNYQETDLGGRSSRKLEWLDSPDFVEPVVHPCDNSKTMVSTTGVNAFGVYMLAYGSRTTHTYAAEAEVDWTVNASGTVTATTSADHVTTYRWTVGGSSGITQGGQVGGYPKNANGATIMVYGPDSVTSGASALINDGRN
jgi:hypothetical protein